LSEIPRRFSEKQEILEIPRRFFGENGRLSEIPRRFFREREIVEIPRRFFGETGDYRKFHAILRRNGGLSEFHDDSSEKREIVEIPRRFFRETGDCRKFHGDSVEKREIVGIPRRFFRQTEVVGNSVVILATNGKLLPCAGKSTVEFPPTLIRACLSQFKLHWHKDPEVQNEDSSLVPMVQHHHSRAVGRDGWRPATAGEAPASNNPILTRPVVAGIHGIVAAGHPIAASAGLQIL